MISHIFVLVVLLMSFSLTGYQTDREVLQALINEIDAGKPKQTLVKIDELIKTKGPSAQLLWAKGRALRQMGEASAAVKAYTESIQLNPKQTESYDGRAMALFRLGNAATAEKKTEQAQAAFKQMLDDASQLRSGKQQSMLMAMATRRLDRPIQTIHHLTSAMSFTEDDSDLANLYAERAKIFKEMLVADLAAEDLVASHKRNPERTTMPKVVLALYDARRFDDIAKIMDERIAAGQSELDLFLDRFGMIGKAGNIKTAVEGLEKLKEKYATEPEIKQIDSTIRYLTQYGKTLNQPIPAAVAQTIKEAQALFDAKSYALAAEKAHQAGEKAERNPVSGLIDGDADQKIGLIAGDAYLKLEQYENALKLYSLAIRFGSKEAHAKRAEALQSCGLAANAMFDLEKACEYQPTKERQIQLAAAYHQSRQFEKTVAACTAAERLGEQQGPVNAYRALAYQELGKDQQALDDYAIAFKSGDNIGWRVTRAKLLVRLGRYDEAKADYVRIRDMAEKERESASDNGPEAAKFTNLVNRSVTDIMHMELAADLRSKMEALIGVEGSTARELTKEFMPTLDVCRAIFDDEIAAVAAEKYSEFYGSGQLVITGGSPENTEVIVDAIHTDTINKGMAHGFDRGWDRLSNRFRPGKILFGVRFAKPGTSAETRLEGFVHVQNQWYYVPRAWRVIPE